MVPISSVNSPQNACFVSSEGNWVKEEFKLHGVLEVRLMHACQVVKVKSDSLQPHGL